MLPLLAAAGRTVLAPDLRGMGHSDPAEDGTFAKTTVAEDIHLIARHLDLGPADLVGMDIGGMVAYAYASRHPDDVRRLVLAETLIPGFGLEAMMNPADGGFWTFGFHAQVELATFLTKGKEADYLAPFYRLTSVRVDAETHGAATYLPHFTGPRGLRGGFQHYGPIIEDGKANRAAFQAKLPMPVLVLNGDQGVSQEPLLTGARQVAEHVETAFVPDASHAFPYDNPRATAQLLLRFFA